MLPLQGAQDIFNELPCEYVEPNELKEVSESGGTSCFLWFHVGGCVFAPEVFAIISILLCMQIDSC